MLLHAFFTRVGVPQTELIPGISIVNAATGLVAASGAMTQVSAGNAPGWYQYDFTGYDEDLDYVITADGGATLQPNDRYKYAGNDLAQVSPDITLIKKATINRLKLEDGDQDNLTIYDDDDTTPLLRGDATDVDGNAISLPGGAPAQRSRLT